ncbi:site-specific integrase [Halobacterium sp. R2-5]|nr:site-specific integrase [Halobacterium sp. R2-5]
MSPAEAKAMYLDERREDARYATRRTIETGVSIFVEWTDEAGIDNMNDVQGRQLRKFRSWCKNTSDNNTVSLNGVMGVLRRFLVFCVEIEAVYPDVPEKTPMPNVPDDEAVSDEKPTDEEVNSILEFLEAHEPYSRRHVEFRLMKELGDRVGAVRAIDVRDVDVDERVIRLRHRPEPQRPDVRGTPLKNGSDGERTQNISQGLADVIQGYLDSPQRHDVTDKFCRRPLLTTRDGRPDITTIRRDIYKLTRPCTYTGECPHDRDIGECDATISRQASECPSSQSPHPLRRWSIEHQIESGVSKELLADRVDVSVPVLNEHYDRRSEERKRQHRLEVLEKIFDDYGDPDETIDANVLVDMFVSADGSVDTNALMDFNREHESEESSSEDSDTPDGQMTLDDLTDGSTGVLHPGMLFAVAGFAVGQLLVDRLRRELETLTAKPGTSLHPNGERMAKGAAAYSLFVGMVAFNLHALALIPGAVI